MPRLIAIILTLFPVLFASGETVSALRSLGYDMRSALRSISSNNFIQTLNRGDGDSKYRSRSGRITRNDILLTGRHLTSDYLYDDAGRLKRAETKLHSPEIDYTEEFDYDLNTNITGLRRYGAKNPATGALLDDLTMTYQGNQLRYISDDATDYPYEASLDFRAKAPAESTPGASVAAPFGLTPGDTLITRPTKPIPGPTYSADYAYDANGNMTQDRHSSITSIKYNELNLPQTVTYEGGVVNTHVSRIVYDASGRKHIVRNGALKLGKYSGDETRYIGQYIMVNDTIDRLQTPYGYLRDGVYHAYVFDYQGNVMAVVAGDNVVQTNLYYSDGLPMNTSTGTTANAFKYTAKELSLFRGLPVYDFTARHTLPAGGNLFRTMDPLAEKYHGISPYAFCAGDPINFSDPTGQDIEAIINDIKYKYCRLDGGGYAFIDADGNQYAGGNVFGDLLTEALDIIINGPVGQLGIDYLIDSDKTCTIVQGDESKCTNYKNGDTIIEWTGTSKSDFTGFFSNERTSSFGMDLTHEVGHSISYFLGVNDESTWYEYTKDDKVVAQPRNEIFACKFENFVRSENSLPLRTYYSGYENNGIIYPHTQSFVLSPINVFYDIYCKLKK